MVALFMLFPQINQEQTELARANFSILRKEAQSILDLVSFYSFPNCFCIRYLRTC